MVRDKIGPVAAFKVVIVIKRLPKTIKNNPNTACQDNDCLKKRYPNIATVKTPRPLHVA